MWQYKKRTKEDQTDILNSKAFTIRLQEHVRTHLRWTAHQEMNRQLR